MTEGSVAGQPRAWLRLEGLVALAVAASLYALTDAGWVWFAILFFAPDVGFLGYLLGSRVGAAVYNALHSYVAPLTASLALVWLNEPVTVGRG